MSIKSASASFNDFLRNDPQQLLSPGFEAEDDGNRILDSLSMIEKIYPEQVLLLCNRSHPRLQYISANCRHLFGFDREVFKNMSVSDFFRQIHPEDIDGLQQCYNFIQSAEPYDPLTHRFVLHYRYRHTDGRYIHLRDEKLAITDDGGKCIYFTLFKEVTDEKFFYVHLDIYRYNKGNALKLYAYNPRSADALITPRQHQIIRLIIRGFSTQEIARQLNVSISTIKNHKQVLFRKVNVNSSVELISLVKRREI
ncbi:MAG: PAS domain-containing protein [Chitinophagaceae bacterium]|nr:PAS domain-containing protein [Chitinophagaceae bacterium]